MWRPNVGGHSWVAFVILATSVSSGWTLDGVAAATSGKDPVLTIETGVPQLFVDDYLIARIDGCRRTLHQPVKDNGGNAPVLALTDEFAPHASTLEANGTIVFDPRLQRYVMFALGFAPQSGGWDRVRLYRFTSADGLHWEKGPDGRAELVYPKSREFFYDSESRTYATNIDLFSCRYNSEVKEFPYQGWQWFANWGDLREGIYFMKSADGLSWHRGQKLVGIHDGRIEQDGFSLFGAGDVTTFTYDPRDRRYLALVKFSNRTAIGPGNRQRSRAFVFMDAVDRPLKLDGLNRVDLVPPARTDGGDAPHDEYYSSTAWRYGSHWLGTLKIWHGEGDHAWSAAGCAYLKLISSRDGLHWRKAPFNNDADVPEVFVANGAEGGNDGRNDGGYITEFSNPPLRVGDELLLYYGASSWGKNQPRGVRVTGGGIFRARLRPDGFVSVDAGRLVTKPLKLQGDELLVNSTGTVSVAVLDEGYQPIAAASVTGDSLSHRVRFGNDKLGALQLPRAVRLRFEINDGGQLYSFSLE